MYVLAAYERQVSVSNALKDDGDLARDIALLIKNDRSELEETPSKQPLEDDVFNWEENDWTYRLSYGMKRIFSDVSVHFTADDGKHFARKVL